MTHAKTLAALADPTRRRMFDRLRRRPRTVGELARLARVSQPAASQHLQVLRRARLVTLRRAGTRHFYCANPAGLVALRRYVESLWADALRAYAEQDTTRHD